MTRSAAVHRFAPTAAFRLRTVLLGLLAVAAAVLLSFRGIYEADLWWHLAQGREAAAGRLVRTNVFSFIYPNYPQTYSSWLYDLAGYLAWQAADGIGIQAFHGALLAVMFVLLYFACRQRAPVPAALAILAIGFFVVEPRAIPRPHVASFAGLAACTLLVERARRLGAAAPLGWAIPIVALWSNLHAECVFGVLLIGLFGAAEFAYPAALPRREALKAIAFSAACLLATVVNPYGWGLERYLYENWSVPQVLNITELQAPSLPTYRAFFVYAAIAALSIMMPWKAATLSELATAAIFGALGARFLRFTPLLFVVTAPVVAERVGRLIARGIDGRAVVATAIAAGLVISRVPIAALAALQAGHRAVAPPEYLSPGMPAFARAAGLRGPVFNSMNLGGYLAWELYPDTRIFQDGRLQAVPQEHIRAILAASRNLADWDALVAGVDWAVLSLPRPNELSGAGRFRRQQWPIVYWDEAFDVRVRRGGRFDALVQSHEYRVLLPESDPVALAALLDGPQRERVRAEARRNMAENPDGITGPAVECLAGAADACAQVERLADRPMFRDIVTRVRDRRAPVQ
jgi:hypothetical protein